MPINFQLSPSQEQVRIRAAAEVLKDVREDYIQHNAHYERFQATHGASQKAVKAGLIKAQIPWNWSGLVEALLRLQSLSSRYAVEQPVSLTAREAVADLIISYKMQVEACRAMTWKAAHCLEHGPGDHTARQELAIAANVYCSNAATKICLDEINAVGIYVP